MVKLTQIPAYPTAARSSVLKWPKNAWSVESIPVRHREVTKLGSPRHTTWISPDQQQVASAGHTVHSSVLAGSARAANSSGCSGPMIELRKESSIDEHAMACDQR